MSSNLTSHGDKKTFIVFLVLAVLTATYFIFLSPSPMMIGFLSILWGGLGLFRLIYLTHYQMDEVPKMLELPVQILFGIGQQEQSRRKNIVRRLTRPDFVLWLAGAILFAIWTIINGLYPNTDYIVKAFGAIEGMNLSLPEGMSAYAILTGLSFYGAVVSIIFMAVTFSYNRHYTKMALIVFVPLITLGMIMVFINGRYATPLFWPEWNAFKGAGLREGQIDFLITNFDIQNSATALIYRFLTLGSIGAYGLYVVALPALVMFIRNIIKTEHRNLKPALGVIGLLCLAAIDLFLLRSPWTLFLSFSLMVPTAILWGYTIRYK